LGKIGKTGELIGELMRDTGEEPRSLQEILEERMESVEVAGKVKNSHLLLLKKRKGVTVSDSQRKTEFRVKVFGP